MEQFLVRALLAGCGMAAVAGPVGCVIIWRRIAYLGDALGHAALLGIVISLVWHQPLMVGVIGAVALFSLLFVYFQQKREQSNDALLTIIASSMLAIGLIAVSKMPELRMDIMSYLWGDILALTAQDVLGIYAAVLIITVWFIFSWRSLLFVAIHEDLAKVRGIHPYYQHVQFMLIVSLLVAIAIKMVGILLITALLIIPASAARRLASTPEQMVGISSCIGIISVACGLAASMQWDTPSGPSIVVAAMLGFVAAQAIGAVNKEL